MRRRELEMCVKCLKSAIDYPNEHSLRFVLDYLEQDLERSRKLTKLHQGHSLTKEHLEKMNAGKRKAEEIKKKLRTKTTHKNDCA